MSIQVNEIQEIQNEELTKIPFIDKDEIADDKLIEFIEKEGIVNAKVLDKVYLSHIRNNILHKVGIADIKWLIRKYLEENISNEALKNKGLEIYLSRKNNAISKSQMEKIVNRELYFHQDDANVTYFYFENTSIEITKNSIREVDYNDLGGVVLKEKVLNRNYIPFVGDFTKSDAYNFIARINGYDPNKIDAFSSMIGYLLSRYKNPASPKAIILNDLEYNRFPEGGSGKGLTLGLISQYRNVVTENGRNKKFLHRFDFQNISPFITDLYFIDDVQPDFEFQNLFSILTEDWHIEKKFKDPIILQFDVSPKIVLSTNFRIQSYGNSAERRKAEYYLYPYYTKQRTPEDEFGRLFFTGWDKDQYAAFDRFMIHCVQIFLTNGLQLQGIKDEAGAKYNLPEGFEDLILASMNDENKFYSRQALYTQFVEKLGIQEIPTIHSFTKFLNIYAKETGKKYIEKVAKVNGKTDRVISIQ